MDKIIRKEYLWISFVLASPLIIGSGKNEMTDNDIVLNGNGEPYIPATAVSGVVRSVLDPEKKDSYFGKVPGYKESRYENSKESMLVFYDANMAADSTPRISKRDFVALDENKTAMTGAKFDMQILEPGIEFNTYIEQNYTEAMQDDYLSEIAAAWYSGRVMFGAKTMRGFGEIKDVKIMRKGFDLSDKAEVSSWLEYNMYDLLFWNNAKTLTPETLQKTDTNITKICLGLDIISAISIRQYTTDPTPEDAKASEPDYKQMSVYIDNEEVPVIPGSSWAGAFKNDMKKLLPGIDLSYFGDVKGNDKWKSHIKFSESQINGSAPAIITRNAIDRFSGGTINGALYTEKTRYGGHTELTISLLDKKAGAESKKNRDEKRIVREEKFNDTLAAAIADLHEGLIAVGGLTSVGRGIFRVTSVNGEEFSGNGEALYTKIKDLIGGEQ